MVTSLGVTMVAVLFVDAVVAVLNL